ncbi:MAG: NAD synthetase, partial [Candidatus Marinimicrobia bacterium]|nr:NAD synthetase [Candidatus Neomarinimicrobiota bacterium]
MMNQTDIQNLLYLISAIGFIVGIKRLSHPKTARSGNFLASLGMLVAIIATLTSGANFDWQLIALGVGIGSILGIVIAARVEMTQMPQMVAIFNGLGGAASGFVASSEYFSGSDSSYIIMCLSVLIGTLTFSGSFIAFGKLQGFISGRAITFTGQQAINALIFTSMIALLSAHNFSLLPNDTIFYTITVLALILGIGLTIPIGGADMPVVISLLNSYSGIAAAATGFLLGNNALIISGSLVGASGLILTNIMCKGMNRSLANVIFGAVGATPTGGDSDQKGMNIKSYSTTEAAMILDAAEKI